MNKKSIIILILLLAISLGVNAYQYFAKGSSNSFGATFTVSATNSSTSTPAVLPTLVVDANSGRKKLTICNDSGTKVYLYKGNFADASAASTTVLLSIGQPVAANTCVSESQETGIWYGQVWATSTASGLNISYIEEK